MMRLSGGHYAKMVFASDCMRPTITWAYGFRCRCQADRQPRTSRVESCWQCTSWLVDDAADVRPRRQKVKVLPPRSTGPESRNFARMFWNFTVPVPVGTRHARHPHKVCWPVLLSVKKPALVNIVAPAVGYRVGGGTQAGRTAQRILPSFRKEVCTGRQQTRCTRTYDDGKAQRFATPPDNTPTTPMPSRPSARCETPAIRTRSCVLPDHTTQRTRPRAITRAVTSVHGRARAAG
jgi:hypothetical protein